MGNVPWSRSTAVVALAVLGCAEVEPEPAGPERWLGGIDAVLAACRRCHGPGGTPPDLTRYETATSCRPDGTPWVRPGDADTLLLSVFEQPEHAGLLTPQQLGRLRDWVVRDRLVFMSDLVHPPGYAAPGAGMVFHGAFLETTKYAPLVDDSSEHACHKCHGLPRESGGAVACTACHRGALARTACDGCHGVPGNPAPVRKACDGPERDAVVGAHAMHTAVPRQDHYPAVSCQICHEVPEAVDSAGHLDTLAPRAEVRFARAVSDDAHYDEGNRTCTVPACHLGRTMAWDAAPAEDPCERCHDHPPEGHAFVECADCHQDSYGDDGQLRPERHMDGSVDVARDCGDCHGDPPPPPYDTPTGAHRPSGTYAAEIPCDGCHVVPAEVTDPGHLDTPLPVEIVMASTVATANGALTPEYDPATKRCRNVGCHGADIDGGDEWTPSWSSNDPLECDACHGLPPLTVRGSTVTHPLTGPPSCGYCHRTAAREPVTLGYRAISVAGKAVHINGCTNFVDGCVW